MTLRWIADEEAESAIGVAGLTPTAATQYVWGLGGAGVPPASYNDGLLFMDLNGDAAETDDCDPDTTAGGEADQDRRPGRKRPG